MTPETKPVSAPREFVVHYGETANPRLVQLKGLPIAYATTPTLIEKTPEVVKAMNRDRLFEQLLLEVCNWRDQMRTKGYEYKHLNDLITEAKELSK